MMIDSLPRKLSSNDVKPVNEKFRAKESLREAVPQLARFTGSIAPAKCS